MTIHDALTIENFRAEAASLPPDTDPWVEFNARIQTAIADYERAGQVAQAVELLKIKSDVNIRLHRQRTGE